MATREGTRASMEFVCICIVPDFCKSPTIVVPYKIYSKFDSAVNFSTNVRFRTRWAFRHNSRLSTVLLDEPGVGGGVLSGVNKGFCRPIDGTASTTVRVNGSFVDYHEGTYMWMNCAGPEGPFNTIGRVKFLGNLLPGPVTPAGKIPKGCILGDSGILADIQSSLGDVDDLIKKGKKLYDLAKTDWSDPSAVLGAIGGVAGIAGLQETAGMLEKAKKLYDTGKKVLDTDWSDPKQALAAVAGVANVAGMDGIAKAAEMASKIRDVVKTDWSDPKAALAAATTIMKSTGLNTMAAALLSDAITSSPSSGGPKLPPFFPKPGTNSNSNGSASPANQTPDKSGGPIPKSPEGNPRLPITPDNLDAIKDKFPLAYQRIMDIQNNTGSLPPNAFLEITKPVKGKDGKPVSENERIAVYIPGEGFSTTQHERDSSSLWTLPDGIRKFFVAGSGPSVGEFFGMQQKEGNWYLFGGLMDLGSPELPGAGAGGNAWFVPDKIFGMDFSKYYDNHDLNYYGNDVRLSDLGKILKVEGNAFWEGLGANPLQWPFQALYSGATTAVGTLTALDNSLNDILGKGDFSSLKDFFGSVFGESPINPQDLGIMNIAPGGCMPEVPALPGQSAPGTGSGSPGSGAPPAKGQAGAPEGNASGAGKDGILITTKQGNPSAELAALDAKFKAENQQALEKAQAEERAKQEKAAQEKAAREQAEKEEPKKDKGEKKNGEASNQPASNRTPNETLPGTAEAPQCKPEDAIVVGIGGTSSGDPNTQDGHVEKLVRDYKADEHFKRYQDGPDQMLPYGTGLASTMQDLEDSSYDHIREQLAERPDVPIDIYGHSRGGYVAQQLADRLQDEGIPVRNVGLYDPVDMAPGYGGQEGISSNVQNASVVRAADDDNGGPDQSREIFRRPDATPNDPTATNFRDYDSTGSHAAIGGNPGTAPFNDSAGNFSGIDAERNEVNESRRSDEFIRDGAERSGAQINTRHDYDTHSQNPNLERSTKAPTNPYAHPKPTPEPSKRETPKAPSEPYPKPAPAPLPRPTSDAQ